jgi:hypothetical protein
MRLSAFRVLGSGNATLGAEFESALPNLQDFDSGFEGGWRPAPILDSLDVNRNGVRVAKTIRVRSFRAFLTSSESRAGGAFPKVEDRGRESFYRLIYRAPFWTVNWGW